jgi:hypothetical protein
MEMRTTEAKKTLKSGINATYTKPSKSHNLSQSMLGYGNKLSVYKSINEASS